MCLKPIVIKIARTAENQAVPCGKCPQCYARRISGWSFRLIQEDKKSDSSEFITLTYAPNKCGKTRNNYLTICKKDVQLFFKRLRKNANGVGQPIKYYCVGEYGGVTGRPHYHAIIFNAKSELIDKSWDLGHVHHGIVSIQSVGYTLKYMCKPHKIPMHRNDDRQPEFSLMSKNWGLITSQQKCNDGIKTTSKIVCTSI